MPDVRRRSRRGSRVLVKIIKIAVVYYFYFDCMSSKTVQLLLKTVQPLLVQLLLVQLLYALLLRGTTKLISNFRKSSAHMVRSFFCLLGLLCKHPSANMVYRICWVRVARFELKVHASNWKWSIYHVGRGCSVNLFPLCLEFTEQIGSTRYITLFAALNWKCTLPTEIGLYTMLAGAAL